MKMAPPMTQKNIGVFFSCFFFLRISLDFFLSFRSAAGAELKGAAKRSKRYAKQILFIFFFKKIIVLEELLIVFMDNIKGSNLIFLSESYDADSLGGSIHEAQ